MTTRSCHGSGGALHEQRLVASLRLAPTIRPCSLRVDGSHQARPNPYRLLFPTRLKSTGHIPSPPPSTTSPSSPARPYRPSATAPLHSAHRRATPVPLASSRLPGSSPYYPRHDYPCRDATAPLSTDYTDQFATTRPTPPTTPPVPGQPLPPTTRYRSSRLRRTTSVLYAPSPTHHIGSAPFVRLAHPCQPISSPTDRFHPTHITQPSINGE